MPISSSTSRSAAWISDSPSFNFPLGNDQSSYAGRCTRTSSFPPGPIRQTSPPAARTTFGFAESFVISPPRAATARFHTLRHRRRASSAAARSIPASIPAANAASPERRPAAHVRSQDPATTASLCSPRIPWSSAAASANLRAGLPTMGATASAAYRTRLALIRTVCNSTSPGCLPAAFTAPRR